MLESCRAIAAQSARLIVVFGCGGDRDRSKRAMMGTIAAGLADRVVVTSDNPRSEDPQTIIDEIIAGISHDSAVEKIVDRADAIRLALEGAAPGDVVLIAGKGHETYQITGDERVPFDDRQIVREWVADNGGRLNHVDAAVVA